MSHSAFEFDVVISFARADRDLAGDVASRLHERQMRVLYDEAESAELAGGDFVTHIAELVRTRARYGLLLLSPRYPLQEWTEAHRSAVQEHSLRDAAEYILPLHDAAEPEEIAERLAEKLKSADEGTGPPRKSHDLRSGNVPGDHASTAGE